MKKLILFAFCLILIGIIPALTQVTYHIDEQVPLGTGAPKNVPCGVDQNNNVISFPWYIH